MFDWLKRNKVEVLEPEYCYDAEIRFRDGHSCSIKGAQEIRHWTESSWLKASDEGEIKYINTEQAEEVTIIRREIIDEGLSGTDSDEGLEPVLPDLPSSTS